jgi:hypothetical protein
VSEFFLHQRISIFFGGFVFGFIFLIILLATGDLLPPKYIPILSPIVILFSAIITLSTFIFTVRINRELARKKNTIDALNNFNNSLFISAIAAIRKVVQLNPGKKAEALRYLANHVQDNISYTELTQGLNQLEHLCQGVLDGFYDKKMLKDSKGAVVVKLWETCKYYIEERQIIQKRALEESALYQDNTMLPFSAIQVFALEWK